MVSPQSTVIKICKSNILLTTIVPGIMPQFGCNTTKKGGIGTESKISKKDIRSRTGVDHIHSLTGNCSGRAYLVSE